ncbi:MAG: DUF488 domain-containing protein [Clostridiales bacterium]|jgi:uncharacterized protein (DUF488 family)|nr:DUF488 domain-containing protein [Clostridiales bacterium]
MKIFTIGFAKKNAEKFFGLLLDNKVRKVADIRLNNKSQLAGFSKEDDLRFFLKNIGNIGYEHCTALVPTKELFDGFRDKRLGWEEFSEEYKKLLQKRNAMEQLDLESLDHACLLCSEDLPEHCHRRLAAEEIQKITGCEIIHL